MEHAIEQVYRRQNHSFKINLSFSAIFQNRETQEYKFYYASNNTKLLDKPKLIQNQYDLNNLLNFLSAKDFPTHLRNQRPNTKWVLERIVNLQIRVFPTTYPLGNPPELPDYIKNNQYIFGLEKDGHSRTYKDNLCFFRCLAIGKFGKTYHNCNQKVKELFNQYCEHFQVEAQDFKGIELENLHALENFYEVQLFAMSLKEDGSAETLYLSQTSFPTKIYMNVYEHHLSFITDPTMYAKSYICNRCGKLSTKMSHNNRHQVKCDGKVKFNLPGGIYKNNPSVFEDMERLGCQNIEDEDKIGTWFACFDFEAYQRNFDDKVDDVEMLQEGTSWNKIHVPVSFSVGCKRNTGQVKIQVSYCHSLSTF